MPIGSLVLSLMGFSGDEDLEALPRDFFWPGFEMRVAEVT